MSLFIVLKSKRALDGKPNELERHLPFKDLPKLVNEEIDFIQADGHELVYYKLLRWYSYAFACPCCEVVRG